MKRLTTLSVILFVAIFAGGCSEVQTVSKAELEQAKSEWQEPKVSSWYYIGSKGSYHYFCHVDLPKPKVYRIKKIELFRIGKEVFPLTKDRDRWQQMLWGNRSPDRTKGK